MKSELFVRPLLPNLKTTSTTLSYLPNDFFLKNSSYSFSSYIYLLQSNILFVYFSECPGLPRAILPVIGVSFRRRRIPRGCWRLINNVILSNGLGNQDFISLPMKLPSRCVYAQTCAVTPVVQLFQDTARFNYNQRPTCPLY